MSGLRGGEGVCLCLYQQRVQNCFQFCLHSLCQLRSFFVFDVTMFVFFPPPQKPHLQLFQDIQQKNQAVEKSHQIGFFMCDPCVCLWLLSAENLAGQGKSLHPLLSGSSASCRHTAAVSHQPQGHRVRGGNRTVDIFICICVWGFFTLSPLFTIWICWVCLKVSRLRKYELSLPDSSCISVFPSKWNSHSQARSIHT